MKKREKPKSETEDENGTPKKKKRDVKPVKPDVKPKSDVTDDEKGNPKKKKCDVKPKRKKMKKEIVM